MKIIRRFLAVALTAVVLMSSTTPVLASETTSITSRQAEKIFEAKKNIDNSASMFGARWYTVGNTYTTVAYRRHGIGSDVVISVDQNGYNGWEYQMNIIMIDVNGRVVWRADNVTGVAADGHWWAGPNVARVQLQIAPRHVFVPARYFRIRCSY